MIIYNVFANNGGMLRVTESMKDIFDYLPDNFPLRVVIFSQDPWPEFDSKRFFWIKWNDSDHEMITKEGIDYYKDIIAKEFGAEKIKLVIGDAFTLRYWENLNFPFCYDAHYLDRPFYVAFHHTPDVFSIDNFSPNPICRQLSNAELFCYKREALYMRRCVSFIANSLATRRHYEEYYSTFTDGKPINVVPVSTELKVPVESLTEKIELYYVGRFHPQKGLHFLFNRKYTDVPIHCRGFDPRIITPEGQKVLVQKNIIIMPWTNDSRVISQEIIAAQIVLFPSIYEPWGLSLQEALGLGKICVANRCQSGHEEQIQHGINGFLVDMNKPSWEDELKVIMQMSDEEKKVISQNAKKSAPQGHAHRLRALAKTFMDFQSQ